MFDTHCHLQFGAFEGREEEVLSRARETGITHIVMPGTDVSTSQKAVALAARLDNAYAAVGIHPHHVFEASIKGEESNVKYQMSNVQRDIDEIEKLLTEPKVVAVGETGVDRYYYRQTKYANYHIDESFINHQKEALKLQIRLAIKHDKSLILHNREAKQDLFEAVSEAWDSKLEGQTVLHCCEPDPALLAFAREHKMYIGVDGDVTYSQKKQVFHRAVPLEILVLETDSPFLTPLPYRLELDKKGRRPHNEPKNLAVIAAHIAEMHGVSLKEVVEKTTANALRLFRI